MANKSLFKSLVGKLIPAADAANSERAPAYAFTPKHRLAQYAATGCMTASSRSNCSHCGLRISGVSSSGF
jgi:60 kDa SS-A/Ro ribonucleoprotein